MPYAYSIKEPARTEVINGLYKYYAEAEDAGIRSRLDLIAQAGMGSVTAALDRGLDTWASLTAASNEKFTVKFEATIRSQAGLLFAAAPDVASQAVQIASKALISLAGKIPVPVVGSVVGKLLELGAGAAVEELRSRAVDDADARVTGSTGGEVRKLFTNDADAMAATTAAIEQYKLVGRYITLMPQRLTTLQEVVTFPAAVFRVREASSALNVSLLRIRDYVESMQERLAQVQKVYENYQVQLKTAMPDAVDTVIDKSYDYGYKKGEGDEMARTYKPIVLRAFRAPPEPGAATQLAAHVAYAIASGYRDGGQGGMEMTSF